MHRRSIVVICCAAVLVVGLGAGSGYYLWQKQHRPVATVDEDSVSSSDSPTLQQTNTLSAANIISQVKTNVGGTMASLSGATAPRAQVTGYSFYTAPTPKQNSQVAFPRSDTELLGVYKTVQSTLSSFGLTPVNQTSTAEATATLTLDYSSSSVYCELGKAPISGNQYGISVSCAEKKDYTTVAEKIKPLYDLYYAAQTTKPTKDVYLSDFTATSSTIQGYAHAELSITDNGQNYTALFYQTPDKNWHFFKTTQAQLLCSDFNTQELRNAYLGISCTDSATQTQSTVQ